MDIFESNDDPVFDEYSKQKRKEGVHVGFCYGALPEDSFQKDRRGFRESRA